MKLFWPARELAESRHLPLGAFELLQYAGFDAMSACCCFAEPPTFSIIAWIGYKKQNYCRKNVKAQSHTNSAINEFSCKIKNDHALFFSRAKLPNWFAMVLCGALFAHRPKCSIVVGIGRERNHLCRLDRSRGHCAVVHLDDFVFVSAFHNYSVFFSLLERAPKHFQIRKRAQIGDS